MIKIAEFLPPTPSMLWTSSKQCGIDYAVGGLPFNEPFNGTDGPYDYLPLLRMKQRYEDAGFAAGSHRSTPARRIWPSVVCLGVMPKSMWRCTLIGKHGRLEIPVWCYEWMTDFNWMRTSTHDSFTWW
jgi:mannonate dehydratase